MIQFTSSREKRFWIYAGMVLVLIFSGLFVGQPLSRLLQNQDIQAVIFVLGMLLVGAAILTHSIKNKSPISELATLFGIAAVYMMFFLRLGLPERSHLIEYSVLTIFIHKALIERLGKDRFVVTGLLAFTISFCIGILDECIQLFLPERVFDPTDILFNGIAVSMAVGSNVIFSWIRKLRSKT